MEQSEFKKIEISRHKKTETYTQNLMPEQEFNKRYNLSKDAKKNRASMRNALRQGMDERYRGFKPKHKVIKTSPILAILFLPNTKNGWKTRNLSTKRWNCRGKLIKRTIIKRMA